MWMNFPWASIQSIHFSVQVESLFWIHVCRQFSRLSSLKFETNAPVSKCLCYWIMVSMIWRDLDLLFSSLLWRCICWDLLHIQANLVGLNPYPTLLQDYVHFWGRFGPFVNFLTPVLIFWLLLGSWVNISLWSRPATSRRPSLAKRGEAWGCFLLELVTCRRPLRVFDPNWSPAGGPYVYSARSVFKPELCKE